MLEIAERFTAEMTRVGLKYREPRDLPNGGTAIACGINGRCNVYDVVFFFDADGHSEYRWVKFYINAEYDVNVQLDAIVNSETSGPVAVELLLRTMKIIDEVYPRIMKAVWSD